MKRFLCWLISLALLGACLTLPAGANGAIPTVRVLLSNLALRDRADLRFTGPYAAVCDGTEAALRDGAVLTVQIRGNELYLFSGGVTLRAGKRVILRSYAETGRTGGIRFTENGNLFPGDLTLTVADGFLRPVLTLSVEDYLLGVLPYEMNDSFPLEALKAQAICARTYALSHRDQSRAWDVVDNTNDQVFRGVSSADGRCAQAVRETVGVVGMYKGKLATCYYAASNGGHTELPEKVWSGSPVLGYYKAGDDPYDLENPESVVRRARLKMDGTELPEAFVRLVWQALQPTMASLGYDVSSPDTLRIDALSNLQTGTALDSATGVKRDVLQFNLRWSGRMWITPSSGQTAGADEEISLFATPAAATPAPVLSGFHPAPGETQITLPLYDDALNALNIAINSTNREQLTIREENGTYILESRRFGHGVGMSQRGAQWMAAHYGWSFTKILSYYYPGMQLMVGGNVPAARPTPPAALFATPGPAASPTPRPTLMPVTAALPAGAYLASVEGIDDDSTLNLRAEPNGAAEILMRLYKHQQLQVLEVMEDPAWVHVRTDSAEGYVMVSFLQKVSP